MKIDILEHEIIDTIDPGLIARYLGSQNWTKLPDSFSGLEIWDKESSDHRHFRVWLPQSRRFADFDTSILRVVNTLAQVEDRSQLQIIEDFETVGTGDIIRVKTEDEFQRHNGTLPLFNGIELMHQARDMTIAAALSTIERREVYPNRRPNQVIDYIKSVRMGQSERGSYIVKLISPIDSAQYQQLGLEGIGPPEAPPFERQVVINLERSLSALAYVANDAYKRGRFFFPAFREVVDEGISANLCEAIAPRREPNEYFHPVEVSISWSYIIQSPHTAASSIVFPVQLMPLIAEAAREFRQKNPEDIVLRGYVTGLRRRKKGDPNSVTLASNVDDQLRSVKITLNEDAYELAIKAHENDSEVSIMGTLLRQGNFLTLENPTNFHIRDLD